jgi:ABC-type branched-subunit amino acid transport system ATPase component/ABC-type branched-subunit amino acid transport system permease subunit
MRGPSDMALNEKKARSGADRAAWRRDVAEFLMGMRAPLLLPALLAAALILFPYWSGNGYWVLEIPLILCFALVVSGVNLSFGFAGELQLGQVFMFAVGAYIPMILATRGVTTDVVALMLLGGALAVLIGVLVAMPALRIGGWSLAMASFFLVITIPDLTSIFIKYTGGLNGLSGIPSPTLLGHTLSQTGLFEVTAVTTVLWFICYRNLVTSRYGVVFRVLRESPVLTKSLGFSTFRLKTTVYALGALPAGIAGCLYGFLTLVLEPSAFGLNLGIGTVAASLFGGTESVYGVFFGAAVLQLGPQKSAAFASYSPVVYGVFLILAAVLLRGGVARLGKLGLRRVARWIDPEIGEGRRTARERRPRGGSGRLLPGRGSSSPSADDGAEALSTIQGKRLEIANVTKRFGGVAALKDVSLTAKPGEVTALIGSNGSGKTTLLNVICGYAVPQAGSVKLDGEEISRRKPHQISRLGIGRTFQTPTIPRGVPVRDVVATGRYSGDQIGFISSILRLPRYWRAQRADRREAMALLDLVGLGEVADAEAVSLPLGRRRLVEVVRALCAEPGVVLLDEPASGLNDEETEHLAQLVARLAAAGATVIVIEHNFRFIRSISQTVHVLHLGELIASGTPDEIAEDRQVIESYLGEAPASSTAGAANGDRRARHGAPGESHAEPLLVVDSLESGYGDLRVLRGISLSVTPGSIEVVLGPNGVGKTTLLSNVAGLLPSWKGSIALGGTPVGRRAAYRRASAGIVLVQEGKRIFRQRTVWQNVMLGTYTLKLSPKDRESLCREVLAGFPILNGRLTERAGGLSGGQQQMLAVAQALAARPKILLLDEPSAGLAPAIVDDLFARLRALADDGLSILLVEQLADKAIAIADHVTVLDRGRIVAAGSPDEFADPEKLKLAYFGA